MLPPAVEIILPIKRPIEKWDGVPILTKFDDFDCWDTIFRFAVEEKGIIHILSFPRSDHDDYCSYERRVAYGMRKTTVLFFHRFIGYGHAYTGYHVIQAIRTAYTGPAPIINLPKLLERHEDNLDLYVPDTRRLGSRHTGLMPFPDLNETFDQWVNRVDERSYHHAPTVLVPFPRKSESFELWAERASDPLNGLIVFTTTPCSADTFRLWAFRL
ncbi:hypothetical protein F5Y19DRAFT_480779 [Xylariaceae sp. FL1651]|nr:hypothetical protein F5Y19DRAFT_480779 [Xylariaceae sp. FL1651]